MPGAEAFAPAHGMSIGPSAGLQPPRKSILKSRPSLGMRQKILLGVAATCAMIVVFTAVVIVSQLDAVECGVQLEA